MKKSHGKSLYYTGPKFVTPISASCVEFCLQKTKTMYLMPKHLLQKNRPACMEQGSEKWLTQTLHHFKRNPSKLPFIQFALLDHPKNGPKSQWPWKESFPPKKCEFLPGSHQSQDLRPRLIRCTDRAQTFHVFCNGPDAMPLEGRFPQYAPLSRWLLGIMKVMGTLWKFIMNSGCSWWMPWATFWGAWSSSAWSCFVLWGDQETENNGVKMSVYTMFHHISLHEVVQLVVSAHLEKDWLIGSSSQVRVNMSNHSFEIWCL